jgi:glycosyltransferase involved in cell wall biosynthesis
LPLFRLPYDPRVPVVSVVVPVFNAEATLERSLASLCAQTLAGDYEVLVVDDGSTDSTARIAGEAPPPVRLIRQARSGAAAARNRGVAEAAADRIAFTDADCFAAPDWLECGLEALESVDLVQGYVSPEPGVVPYPFDRTLHVEGAGPFFETANLFARRALVKRIGGFREAFRGVGGRPFAEDMWFGWRARRAGARMAFSADARVHHAVFRQGARDFVRERWRRRLFPRLVAEIPELRDELCFQRWFLDRRTAELDVALAGLLVALAAGRRLPLVAVFPYGLRAVAESYRWRTRAPVYLAASVAADLTGFAALVLGSAESRALVI